MCFNTFVDVICLYTDDTVCYLSNHNFMFLIFLLTSEKSYKICYAVIFFLDEERTLLSTQPLLIFNFLLLLLL